MAQELLSTFGTDPAEVALALRTGGAFEITCNGPDDLGAQG
jgi:selenoprotein W-related protein